MHNNPVKPEDQVSYIRDVMEWADTYGYEVRTSLFRVSVYVETCKLYIHKNFITGAVTYELLTLPETISQFLFMQDIITQYTLAGE